MLRPLNPLVLHPRPSRVLLRLQGCVQALTLIALLVSPLAALPKAILATVWLLLVLFTQWRVHGSAGGRILRLRLDQAGEARLLLADGREWRDRLREDTLITPWLILLRFEGAGPWRHTSLLLGPDSLTDEETRRLRLLLRFGQPARQNGMRS